MLDSHEAHDVRAEPIVVPGSAVVVGQPVRTQWNVSRQRWEADAPEPRRTHVDGDDMTYSPVSDNRTGTQRINELAGAVALLAKQVAELTRRFEEMQGD